MVVVRQPSGGGGGLASRINRSQPAHLLSREMGLFVFGRFFWPLEARHREQRAVRHPSRSRYAGVRLSETRVADAEVSPRKRGRRRTPAPVLVPGLWRGRRNPD